MKPIAITVGVGVLAVGSAVTYWQLNQPQGCVRLTSNAGQEVTYSRGCIYPQRYKKWVLTASATQTS